MNQDESLARRRKDLLKEIERRGFETVVLLNEVVNQNPATSPTFALTASETSTRASYLV